MCYIYKVLLDLLKKHLNCEIVYITKESDKKYSDMVILIRTKLKGFLSFLLSPRIQSVCVLTAVKLETFNIFLNSSDFPLYEKIYNQELWDEYTAMVILKEL